MKQIIHTDKAPQAIGPYSQAVKAGQFLFVSGQVPFVPGTGEIVSDDIQEQTKQSMENLKAIIEKAGATMADVVKTVVFIKDMDQFGLINEIYGKYFPENPPARACVEVARLPKDVGVEIEAVVCIK